MSEKFKISLPGHSIDDNRLANLVVDSSYPSPKVDTQATPPHAGIFSLQWNTTTAVPLGTVLTLASFKHNLNIIPTVLGVFKWDNGSRVLQGIMPFQYGQLGMIVIDSDDTYVNLKYVSFDFGTNPVPAFVMQVRFYVFAERGF